MAIEATGATNGNCPATIKEKNKQGAEKAKEIKIEFSGTKQTQAAPNKIDDIPTEKGFWAGLSDTVKGWFGGKDNSNVITKKNPDGTTTEIKVDNNGRPTSATTTHPNGGSSTAVYDENGKIRAQIVKEPDGTRRSTVLDEQGRPQSHVIEQPDGTKIATTYKDGQPEHTVKINPDGTQEELKTQ